MPRLPYIKVFTSFIEVAREMPDETAGQLFKALLEYGNGHEPELPAALWYVWVLLKQQLDRDAQSYDEKAERMKRNHTKSHDITRNHMTSLQEKEKEEEKEEDKEEDKEKEKDSLCADAERERDKIAEYARGKLASVNYNSLKKLLEMRATVSDELIKAAIDATAQSGGGSLKYTLTVLDNWIRDGVKTPAEAAGRGSPAPAKPMITRKITEDEFDASDIMNRKRR